MHAPNLVVAVAWLLAYAINNPHRWRRFVFLIFLALAVAAVWWVFARDGVHVLVRDFATPAGRA